LREDIKERIEMINKGKMPEGYKKTKLGVIPEAWKLMKIKDCLERVDNPVEVEPDEKYTQIGIRSHGKGLFYKEAVIGRDLGNKRVFWIEPDRFIVNIVFAWEQAVGRTTQYESGMIASHRFPMYKPVKNRVAIDYLVQYFLTQKGNEVMEYASPGGAGRNKTLGQERFMKSYIVCPSCSEQDKIVEIIKKWSELTSLQEKLIEEKRNEKKWFMQNLLTGKLRLPGFDNQWKKTRIGDFITEVSEKTTTNYEYEILSVTKNGIFKQSDQFNKQIASEDNIGYKILRKGNLVFSTMNLWMGSLDVLEQFDIGIVSPAYKIFEFNNELMLPCFGKYYMRSSYMIWRYNINSEQGASVVRKNLDLDSLLDTHVKIPNINEQKAIAQILSKADREIELLEKQLELFKLEKKAIMQLLLTGIVRVNEN